MRRKKHNLSQYEKKGKVPPFYFLNVVVIVSDMPGAAIYYLLSSFAFVNDFFPNSPSAVIPFAFWNALTAFVVFLP